MFLAESYIKIQHGKAVVAQKGLRSRQNTNKYFP
jgi:hypothetical protein